MAELLIDSSKTGSSVTYCLETSPFNMLLSPQGVMKLLFKAVPEPSRILRSWTQFWEQGLPLACRPNPA